MQISSRLLFIDYLRIAATLVVVIFHSARPLDGTFFHIELCIDKSIFSILTWLLGLWIMPVFFIMAGMSAFYSLKKRRGTEFLRERAMRLGIPFLFLGFIISFPQVYIERFTHGQFSAGILDFLPHYFDGLYGLGGNFPWMGLHLWFLLFLSLFSALLIVIHGHIDSIGSRIALFPDYALLFMPLPMILVDLIFRPDGLGMREFGGHSLLVYLYLYILGYLLAAVPNSLERMRHRWLELSAGALIFSSVLLMFLIVGDIGYEPGVVLDSLATFYLLAASIAVGQIILQRDHPLRRWGNEAIMPVYILHQPIIVISAFLFFWPLTLPASAVFLLLFFLSLSLSLLLHLILMRRVSVLRIIFGIK